MENKFISRADLQTPCFILDETMFVNNINNFSKVLGRYFDEAIIGYSVKTNSLPRLLYLAMENGCFAEVVSDDEYQLAKKIGFESEKIIFNGPVKQKESFLDALKQGSIINIDSKREVEWLLSDSINNPVDIGIRVNFDLEKELPGQTSTGNSGGRFGFCYENGELHEIIERMRRNDNIRIARLHMHVSNASKSVDVYSSLARMACRIIDEEELNIKCIDIGGGFFGGGDNGECYEDYVVSIFSTLKKNGYEKIKIIVEPGASVVATAVSYLSTVVDKKKTTYGEFIITDGTRLHIDPFMQKNNYVYSILPNREEPPLEQVICGYTCMEKDRIMKVKESPLSIGDQVEYHIVGSYTMCFNPLFISYLPRVYSRVDLDKYICVRVKWGVEEYVQGSRWVF